MKHLTSAMVADPVKTAGKVCDEWASASFECSLTIDDCIQLEHRYWLLCPVSLTAILANKDSCEFVLRNVKAGPRQCLFGSAEPDKRRVKGRLEP